MDPTLIAPEQDHLDAPDTSGRGVIPYLDHVLTLPQRVLPFVDSENLSSRSMSLYFPSCTALETRGRENRFFWPNQQREGETHLLKFTIGGKGYLEDKSTGLTHILPPGHAFLIPIPSNTTYYCNTGETWTFLWVNFVGDSPNLLCAELCQRFGYVYDLRRFPQVFETLLSLYQHRLENHRYNTYYVSAQVYRLLMGLYQYHDSPASQIPASIVDACQFMKASLDNSNLSIEEIAARSGYSKYHFTRKFKQHMRLGPHQYLVKLRLEKAVDLITTTDLPIKIISERVGFKEITHFYNIFKKHMKITPGSLNRPPH